MNYIKFQKETFNRLITLNPIGYSEIDNENILVTNDNNIAYVIPKDAIFFNLGKCTKIDSIGDLLHITPSDKKLKVTDIFRKYKKKRFAQKLTCDQFTVWAQKRFIANVIGCELYAKSPTDRILATDINGKAIAAMMPVEIHDNGE